VAAAAAVVHTKRTRLDAAVDDIHLLLQAAP
jgi:hypothetical protein